MTDVNIAKTNIKVSLILAASFVSGSLIISFRAGEIYKDFTAKMQKYENYQAVIERHESSDSAVHAAIWRRLAHE